MKQWFASLRARLFFLILVAMLPAFALTLYTGLERRRAAAADAHGEALRIARLAAAEQNDVFQSARQLAFTLAQVPAVKMADTKACSPLLADLLTQSPQYSNIAVAAPTGDVVCSALSLTGRINLSDRDYFQRALATRDFVMSGYVVGRVSRNPSVIIAYPVVVDGHGPVRAVVVVSLDLRRVNKLLTDARLPQGSTLLVIDQNAVILARYPGGDEWIGTRLADSPLTTAILARHAGGTADTVGLDGVPRLYGITTLSAVSAAGDAYLAVGIPRSIAFAEPNRSLARNLIALGLVSVLSLVAARVVAERLVLRRTAALVAATKRLAAGDLRARAGGSDHHSELGQLARSFDEMAEALEERTAERARAAGELVRSEKMAALGRLAAGIAHELKNPLAVIAGRIQILKLQMGPGQQPTLEVISHHIARFDEATQRMLRIMESLSTYSKPAKPEPTPLDLGELLAATREVLAHEARRHDVSLTVEVSDVLPKIRGDRSALMQVFVNLAMNAVQAMADTRGGHVTLKASETGGSGGTVVAEVIDTGPGIPADALGKIWEPFYTTKAEGTGIGLSIVRSLVEQQPGATITVESRPGVGTTFRVTMPSIA